MTAVAVAGRPSAIADPDRLKMRVEDAIASVRDRLASHVGDVEVLDVTGGDILLEFTGACSTCPAKATTFASAVLPIVEQVPGVCSVSVKDLNVSNAALKRIRAMFEGDSG